MFCEPETDSLCHLDVSSCTVLDTGGLVLVEVLGTEAADAPFKASFHEVVVHSGIESEQD